MSSDVVKKLLEKDDAALATIRRRLSTTHSTTSSTPGSPSRVNNAVSTATATLSDRAMLVLHFGSRYTRAGFAGEDIPRMMIKTCVTDRTGNEVWLMDIQDREERKEQTRAFFHQVSPLNRERGWKEGKVEGREWKASVNVSLTYLSHTYILPSCSLCWGDCVAVVQQQAARQEPRTSRTAVQGLHSSRALL